MQRQGAAAFKEQMGNRASFAADVCHSARHQSGHRGTDIGAEDNRQSNFKAHEMILGQDHQDADGDGGGMDNPGKRIPITRPSSGFLASWKKRMMAGWSFRGTVAREARLRPKKIRPK